MSSPEYTELCEKLTEITRNTIRESDTEKTFHLYASRKHDYAVYYCPRNLLGEDLIIDGLEKVVDFASLGKGFLVVSMFKKIEKELQLTMLDRDESCIYETSDASLDESSTTPIAALNFNEHVSIYCGQAISFKTYGSFGGGVFHPGNQIKTSKYLNLEDLCPLNAKQGRFVESCYLASISTVLDSSKSFTPDLLPSMLIKCDHIKPQRINWLGQCFYSSDENRFVSIRSVEAKTWLDVNQNQFVKNSIERIKGKNMENGFKRNQYTYYCFKRLDKRDVKYEERNCLTAEFVCKEVTHDLSSPPLSSHALLKITPNSDATVLRPQSMEIERLDLFCDMLLNEDVSWDEEGTGVSKDDLEQFINQSMSPVSANEKVDTSTTESESDVLEVAEAFKRSDIDFAGQFWLLLKNCSSIDNLSFCIQTIFDATLSGRLQPAINSSNQTKFRRLIQEFYEANCGNQDLSTISKKFNEYACDDEKLLTIVAELGIDKTKHDYLAYFGQQDLATASELSCFIKPQHSIEEQMDNLWKLHKCFEAIAYPNSIVQLHADSLRSILRAAISFYSQNEISATSPTYILSIPAYSPSLSKLHYYCKNFLPNTWMVTNVMAKNMNDVKHHNVTQCIVTRAHSEDDFDVEESFNETIYRCQIVVAGTETANILKSC